MTYDIEIQRLNSAGPPEFDCGAAAQNIFLQSAALDAQASGVSATHIAYMGNVCVGYLTLAAATVRFERHERPGGALVSEVPALLVAQLAVSSNDRGQGLGEWLLRFAAGIAQFLRYQVGCRYLAVDCADSLVPFYRRLGFAESKGERRARTARAGAPDLPPSTQTHRLCRDLLNEEWHEAEVAPAHRNMTEMHRAAAEGDVSLLKALIDAGVSTELTMGRGDDGMGWGAKPLHLAVARAKRDAFTLLLSRGANVDAIDGNCESVLHWAVRYEDAESVRTLLAAGANTSLEGGNAVFTPLDYAVLDGLDEITKLLRSAGGTHSTAYLSEREDHTADTKPGPA